MATALQVIVTEDCTAGKAGELVKVKPGYARNFLLPKGLAVVADDFAMAQYEAKKAELEKLAAEKRQAAETQKENLGEEASVTIESKAGESGKLFGAITKEKIAEAISTEFNFELNKENIKLNSPIKTLGEHPVEIDLGSFVNASVLVKVVAEK